MFLAKRIASILDLPDVDELFTGLFSGAGGAVHIFPPLNCWSGKDCAYVSSELPGFKSEDIDVSIVGDTLVLRGRCEGDGVKDAEMLREERRIRSFERSIPLPFRVDADNVEAHIRNGVLWVKLPRSERDMPKQIKISQVDS